MVRRRSLLGIDPPDRQTTPDGAATTILGAQVGTHDRACRLRRGCAPADDGATAARSPAVAGDSDLGDFGAVDAVVRGDLIVAAGDRTEADGSTRASFVVGGPEIEVLD
jgi:hypothetical protein